MPERLAAAFLAFTVTACTGIGPPTVPHDRIDYGGAIDSSWKEQTLLNIVRMRYADVPIFLDIAQVVAGYSLQSTIGGSLTLGNFTSNLIDRLTASGNAAAAGTYTDRPTVVYQPLTGVDFLKALMTPIPPSRVLFVVQSGYDPVLVLPIMLDSINGINNESAWLKRPADPRFGRLVELIREAQRAGALQIRIEHPKEGAESSVLVFGPSKDPDIAAKSRELRNLLGLRSDIKEIQVYFGGYSGKDTEIDMTTRSMLQILQQFAATVRVPESDVAEGRASTGLVEEPRSGPVMRILVGDAAPKDASVAVQYDNRWFWIADTDIQSKTTFQIVILLFSISETGVKGPPPVINIPAQ